MTQRKLAAALDVDVTYISKIETGKAPPPARDKIEVAAKVLGLGPAEREELFRLADKIPKDFAKFLSNQPRAFQLFRTIRQAPAHEQAELLDKLIREAESARLSRDNSSDD
jgi:HTH-type transcriptional regulator, competence development regulator